jgi:hypothetical protein
MKAVPAFRPDSAPPRPDPLTAALRRALESERDPDLRQWAERLLAGDEAAPDRRAAALPCASSE